MSEITASAAPPLRAAAEKLKFYGLWAAAAIARAPARHSP